MTNYFYFIALLLLISLLGCISPETHTEQNELNINCSNVNSISHDGFAFDLFNSMSEDDNLLVSPYSVRTALSMLAMGTNGSTRDALVDVLGASPEVLRDSYYCSTAKPSEGYMLEIANSVWIDEGFSVKPTFLEFMKYFRADVYDTYSFRLSSTVDKINGWVSQKTHDHIDNIVSELKPEDRLVLVNAVYFKGSWESAFKKDRTFTENFTNPLDSTVYSVEFMHGHKDVLYAEDDSFVMVGLPYKGDDVVMYFVKPISYADGMPTLTLEEFESLKSNAAEEEVALAIPKFTYKSPIYSLKEPLSSMGLSVAFDPASADLSGISDQDLYVSEVFHKTFIKVDEEGTEAAGATAITIGLTAMPIMKEFRADTPFYYVIYHRDHGILFIGRYMHP